MMILAANPYLEDTDWHSGVVAPLCRAVQKLLPRLSKVCHVQTQREH
jgi:hypothetical protein